MKKKILSICMAFMMLFALLPAEAVLAAEGNWLSINSRELQILAGGKLAFEYVGVRNDIRFQKGDRVKLTLNEGFSFVEGCKVYDGSKQVVVSEWGANEIVVLAPQNDDNGFDLNGLTIMADPGQPVGKEVKLTASMEGCAPVSEVVASVVSKITDKLKLDVEEKSVFAGGKASFDVLGVDKELPFKANDLVTLTLNEGFSFVEGNKFYDGNGTLIKVGKWSPAEIVVLAPENPGFGFDLEKLEIEAGESLPARTKAVMTVSMGGHDSVKKTVATVVQGKAPADENMKSEKTKEMILKVDSTEVIIDGEKVMNDSSPVVVNGTTFLPIRIIAENMGASIGWDGTTKAVSIKTEDTEIVVYVDKTDAVVNGQQTQLEKGPFVKDGRTYLPVRFVSEALGAKVAWNGAEKTITISK